MGYDLLNDSDGFQGLVGASIRGTCSQVLSSITTLLKVKVKFGQRDVIRRS
jgi:hypothetical protein